MKQWYPDLSSGAATNFYWDRRTLQRYDDPLYLEQYGYKVYSQNDEDGIIAEIFRRIGTTDRRFIEFGVENGLESNTHYLLLQGWSGLWIDASEKNLTSIHNKFAPVIATGQLRTCHAFIDRDNINQLFEQNGFTRETDLLSIDIDGNDYHIMEVVSVISPRVLIVEYNAKFPPECDWYMAYNESHRWDGGDRYGASLKALERLGRSRGYQLVGTNLNGVNAFFVRSDLAGTGNLFPTPACAENLYNPPRFDRIRYPHTGFPARVCVLNGQEGLEGAFSYGAEPMFYPQYGFYTPEYDRKGNFRLNWMNASVAKFILQVNQLEADTLYLKLNQNKCGAFTVRVDGEELGRHRLKEVEIEEFNIKLPRTYPLHTRLEITIEVDHMWIPDTKDDRPLGIGILQVALC